MPARTDRPTSRPEFDPEAYAKESDSRIARAPRAEPDLEQLLDPSSEVRLSTRPPIGDFLSLEAWAHELAGTPVVVKSGDALTRLPLDHRAGFLLSLIDGSLDFQTIIEVSGMEREEGLEILRELVRRGVVEFKV
jgi:hypothetical protein